MKAECPDCPSCTSLLQLHFYIRLQPADCEEDEQLPGCWCMQRICFYSEVKKGSV